MKKQFFLTVLTALILALTSVGFVQAEILPAYGEGQNGRQAMVLCETLSLRREPSVASNVVKTLRYGDMPIVIRVEDGWAYCALGDAETSPTG
ncbi:MAG: hypothetical protein IJ174_05555 [Clostridia bacterium]|nr:hypothetical protein [Clostridia bacterium]